MMTKSYTANAYRDGQIVGSVTGTVWFWRSPYKIVPTMLKVAKDAYGGDVAIAELRRL